MNKLITNKKAQGFNELYAIPYLVFIAVLMVSIVFIVRTSTSYLIDTSQTELSTYYNSILYSKQGVSYYDTEIDRVYPGMIAMNKFESSTLNSALHFIDVKENQELPSAKLTLTNLRTNQTRTIYWNEEWFTRLDIKSGFAGLGSPNKLDKTLPVSIRGGNVDVNRNNNGILRIEIIVPR